MDTIRRLVVISILGCMSGEVGGARREYGAGEPLVFAAVPLHAPVPVLHVLSPAAPAQRPRRPPIDLELDATAPLSRYQTLAGAGSRQRPRPTRYRDTDYEESYEYTRLAPRKPTSTVHNTYEDEYESYSPATAAYSSSHLYSAGSSVGSYGDGAGGGPVLYARPSPSGGYTYRRPAPTPAPTPTPTKPAKEPQYILKIHKYRIVKDRRRR